jgi:uncharacterized protein (DUF1330 family)
MTEAAVPKAYIMVMYRSSPEPTTFAQYGELAIRAVRASGGRMLARGMPAKTYEAGMNERMPLIEFDSLEQAIGSRESADFASCAKLGDVVRDVRVIEGS